MPFINDKLAAMESRRPEPAGRREGAASARYTFDIAHVMNRLEHQIYGQAEALQAVKRMLTVVKAGIHDPEKPLYAALFLGPTGVGKTEIVKVLAEAIHGDRSRYCRVDMNTLSQEHYAAALTGAPPGYAGSKEGATILDKAIIEGTYGRPGIVLFDEMEKASRQVLVSLLNVLDNGMLRMASGTGTIDFRNTIVMLTGNLGARDMFVFASNRFSYPFRRLLYYMQPRHWKSGHAEKLAAQLVTTKLERTFPPEYVNRMDDIIVFQWLGKADLQRMIGKFAEQLNDRLRRHNCRVHLKPSAIDLLADRGYDRRYGGRALKRAFRQWVEAPLAQLLLHEFIESGPYTYIGERSRNGQYIEFTLEPGDE